MIKLYGDTNGRIVRIGQTDDPYEIIAVVEGAVSTAIIDPATNAALVADYQANPALYTLLAGVVYKSGQAVTVNAPGPDTVDANNTEITPDTIASTIKLLNQGISAWDGLTAAQKQTFVLNNFKKVMQVLRGLLRIALWLYRRLA